MTNEWLFPRGSLRRDGWQTVVDDAVPGWRHTGLRIAELAGPLPLPAAPVERMIVPLVGDCTVETPQATWRLTGRDSVFAGPADVVYLGIDTAATITGSGRVAVAEAPATEALPAAVLRAADCPVELRGAGGSSRQVHNFGVPGALAAQRLIVCEVLTPAGNWSSYPAHKHDDATATESRLEEIYYFEAQPARGARPTTDDAFGLFATYASDDRPIDTAAIVRTGDVALVPYGYHGPAAAAPGYDLYYLNVMAGSDPERAWRISDDPAHAWVRDTWAGEAPDPRLPFAKER